MPSRSVPLFMLVGLLAGCPSEAPAPSGPTPEPLTADGVTFPVTGTLQGPKSLLSTTEITSRVFPFAEEGLPGVRIYLADAKLQPLKDSPTTLSGPGGSFSFASPHRAGFVMAKTASASAPLIAFYRTGQPAALSVASTMVAWKVSADLTAKSVALTALDPAKIKAATDLVGQDLVKGDLKPDYSFPTWGGALDIYTYQRQGAIAKAFNAIIPGSVAPSGSR